MLTENECLHFETFGFVVLHRIFEPDELVKLRREFDGRMTSAYSHAPFDGTVRHWTPMLGTSTPLFSSLLEDSRLCGVAEQLYGSDVIGIIADANRYVGDTKWHPDTGSIHQFGVKFAFYLEPVDAESGALRVIPGSHRQPFHDQLKSTIPSLSLDVTDVPAHVCASSPGDVVAFDLRLWHASHGGSDDRAMCTCVYYNNPSTVEEIEATRKQAENSGNTSAQFGRPEDPIFDPDWVANRVGSAKRQQWLDRMRELGYFSASTEAAKQ
ncbi:MAG: hypothetical protein HOH43_04915 [Candidatus Latescibacteria bacterium]|jgi:hypothetical protein|nr:hypothetical protein [Candidatus Latescibacterota bacterium]